MNEDKREVGVFTSSRTTSVPTDVRFFSPILHSLASTQCYLAMFLPSKLCPTSPAALFIYIFNPEQHLRVEFVVNPDSDLVNVLVAPKLGLVLCH